MQTPNFLNLNEFIKPVELKVVPDTPSVERVYSLIMNHEGLTSREISEHLVILENTVRCCIHRLMQEGSIKRAPKVAKERRVRWVVGVDEEIANRPDRSAGLTQRTVSEWEPVDMPQQTPFSALFK